SAYMRSVAEVQAANADANNSLGEKPRFFPPTATGSSAIRVFPDSECISILYNSFPICDVIFAMLFLFRIWGERNEFDFISGDFFKLLMQPSLFRILNQGTIGRNKIP